jgi:hypothetical protein
VSFNEKPFAGGDPQPRPQPQPANDHDKYDKPAVPLSPHAAIHIIPPPGIVLLHTKWNRRTISSFALRWLYGELLLTQSVRHSKPAARCISIPQPVFDVARLAGASKFIWRYDPPSLGASRSNSKATADERTALWCPLAQISTLAVAVRNEEYFIPLDRLRPARSWPRWRYVTAKIDVVELAERLLDLIKAGDEEEEVRS